ncbi:hypothetical protein JDV02_004991 [Purpureocillium takamizusanense]|uniref:Uncharacterized protein n=1 Tax=Purpureocillium takamizusanense TaxID=2060973 RepID=A0A9Q8QFL4_9HYPO|nr:uncharacterized protein JDV02_004991 [Purpureocillium takamizusanense]UNI18735.1 hypothetical protein JDV02_004991 [Purpureocillium takamizusanense]
MGGKTWSREEELYFWRTVVPLSPKAAADPPAPVEWSQLAADMQQHFGLNARRRYTSLMLYEHYFQNITTRHFSPKSADLVREHIRELVANGKDPEEVAKSGGKPKRPSKRKASAGSSGSRSKQPPKKRPATETQSPLGQSAGPAMVPAQAPTASASNNANQHDITNAYAVPRQQYYPPVLQARGLTHSHPSVASTSFHAHNLLDAAPGQSSQNNALTQNTTQYSTPTIHDHSVCPGQQFFSDVNWNNSAGQDSGYMSGASSNHLASPTSHGLTQGGPSPNETGYSYYGVEEG